METGGEQRRKDCRSCLKETGPFERERGGEVEQIPRGE